MGYPSKTEEESLEPTSSRLGLLRREPQLLSFGMLLMFVSSYGQTYFVALFNPQLQGKLSLSEADIGLVYALATLASAATMPFAGVLLDRLDLRRIFVYVCLGLVAGGLLLLNAGHYLLLGLAYYLLRLCGQGMCGQLATVPIARYIRVSASLALGIAPLGLYLAQILFPPTTVYLLATKGWEFIWWLVVGSILIVVLPLGLWLLRGQVLRHQRWQASLDASDSKEDGQDATAESPSPAQYQWTRLEVMRDWRFWCMVFAMTSMPYVATAIFFHQTWLVDQYSWTLADWALGVVVFSVCSFLVTPISGAIIDRIGTVPNLPIAPVCLACAVAVFALFDNLYALYVGMAIFGVGVGFSFVIFTTAWVHFYGTRHLGAIRSLTSAIGVTSTAVAPWFMGVVIDWGASGTTFQWICLAYTLIGMVMLLPVMLLDSKARAPVTA